SAIAGSYTIEATERQVKESVRQARTDVVYEIRRMSPSASVDERTMLIEQLEDERMRLRLTDREWRAVLGGTGLRTPELAKPAALAALLAELRKMTPAK